MNNKVKLAIAVAVGIVGGGLISSLGGGPEEPKHPLLGSNPVASFPEWTRDGSAFRCKDGKVQGCISGSKCGTSFLRKVTSFLRSAFSSSNNSMCSV